MARARRPDSAWRYCNFRLVSVGETVSAFGATLVPVALAFAVPHLAHSASALGDVLGAEAVAIVVFLLPAGVLADRWPRRRVMVLADIVQGGSQAAAGVLLVTGHPAVGLVAALAAVDGAGIALFWPACTGLTLALAGTESLQQANSLQLGGEGDHLGLVADGCRRGRRVEVADVAGRGWCGRRPPASSWSARAPGGGSSPTPRPSP
ncbi:MAG: MFS transporter [Acidimicrobiales bacterium]